MYKAVAIPYVIALVLGVVVIGSLSYLFVSQGGKTVGVGVKAECDAVAFSFCQGHRSWDNKCGQQPDCSKLFGVAGPSVSTSPKAAAKIDTLKGGLT